MTTAEVTPTSSYAPAPQQRTGTRVWLLLLVLIAAAAVYYFVAYERKPHVVLITSGDGAYWDPVIAGAQQAASDHDVTLVVDRIKSDPFVQADVLKQRMTQKGVDGIAVSPLNASIQANLLADAASYKTLVTLDSDSPVTGRFLFVGTDNYAAGREAGENVKEAIPEGGEVIICLGNPDKENTQHRRQGVIDELLDRPAEPNRIPDPLDTPLKGEKYTIVQTLVDDSDRTKAIEIAAAALKAHPNVKCFVGLLGYSTPAILQALEGSGKLGQVKVVGFDIEDKTKEAIGAGNVYATIMQDQFGQGYHAVRVLADKARNVRGGFPLWQSHSLPYRAIRKDNLADARHNTGEPTPANLPPAEAKAAAAAEGGAPTTAPSQS